MLNESKANISVSCWSNGLSPRAVLCNTGISFRAPGGFPWVFPCNLMGKLTSVVLVLNWYYQTLHSKYLFAYLFIYFYFKNGSYDSFDGPLLPLSFLKIKTKTKAGLAQPCLFVPHLSSLLYLTSYRGFFTTVPKNVNKPSLGHLGYTFEANPACSST